MRNHLPEKRDLGKRLFVGVGKVLQSSGFQIKTGTMLDRRHITLGQPDLPGPYTGHP